MADYEAALTAAIAANDTSQLPNLRSRNENVAKTIGELIQKLTFLKTETPDIQKERDTLIERLRRIQQDYNGLLVNTDALQTLKRIREQESSEANRLLYMYVFFFVAIALGIVLYLLFVVQKKDSTAPRASIPPITPALV